MHYVYLLQSALDNRRRYTGFTHNLRARLASHNAGQNRSTIPGRPWRLVSYFAFSEEAKARAFERYLKSGSGRTYAQRHLV
jgi:predicted GIY-YIG superfamily endonuclease